MVQCLHCTGTSSAPPSFAQSMPPVQNLGFHGGWSHCTAFNHLVSTASTFSPEAWHLEAPNPLPFLVSVICLSFNTQTKERSAQIIPQIYKPVPSLWTPSAFAGLPPQIQSAVGNYLVDLGKSVNSHVQLLCGCQARHTSLRL